MHKAFANYLDERLEQWAAFYRQSVRLGVSYPPCSMEYRMMTEGNIPRKERNSPKPLASNESAEEIEAFVIELNTQNPFAAKVLRKHYIEAGSAKQKAADIQMGYAQFCELTTVARAWMLGRLSATPKLKRIISKLSS